MANIYPADWRLWEFRHPCNSHKDRATKGHRRTRHRRGAPRFAGTSKATKNRSSVIAPRFFSISCSDGIRVMNGKIRKNVSNCGTFVTAIYLGSIGIAIGQDAPRSSAAGVFSAEQAKRGNAAYDANCASCHGSDLISTDREFPNLTSASFRFSWIGKTIGEKFEFIRNTMPPKEERSLDDQVYLDIVTYILYFNKVPSGDQTLKPDLDELKKIVISAPPT